MHREGILVFAGYDPSGGAGILQDIYIIRKRGIYAFGIVSAMVYENTCRVDGVFPVDVDMQINLAMEEGIKFKIFKLGLIHSRRQIESILTLAKKIKPEKIVVDPIFFSSTKGQLSLLSPEDYRNFIKTTDAVLIPNLEEFHSLFGRISPKEAAITHNTDILLKTYKVTDTHVIDLIATRDGNSTEVIHRKLDSENIHGTGCTIASLLAANLFRETDIRKAYARALDEFEKSIRNTIKAGCQRIIL